MVLTMSKRAMYQIDKAVPTNGVRIFQAQAKLRYFVYHIVPEKVYEWIAKHDHQFARVR